MAHHVWNNRETWIAYLLGLGAIAVAITSLFTGVLPGKPGSINRVQHPNSFWLGLALYLTLGAFFLWFGLTS